MYLDLCFICLPDFVDAGLCWVLSRLDVLLLTVLFKPLFRMVVYCRGSSCMGSARSVCSPPPPLISMYGVTVSGVDTGSGRKTKIKYGVVPTAIVNLDIEGEGVDEGPAFLFQPHHANRLCRISRAKKWLKLYRRPSKRSIFFRFNVSLQVL